MGAVGEQKLTKKQEVFVREYVATNNASEAARRAGYTGNANIIKAMGSENLTKPAIASRIEELKKELGQMELLAPEEIKKRFQKFGEESSRDSDKLRAYELLAKSQGLFQDNNAQVNIFQQFNVDDVSGLGDDDDDVVDVDVD